MPHVAPYNFVSGADGAASSRRPRVSVGIVNNMPDAALEPTERQFVSLLQSASAAYDIRIHLFTLPGIARGQAARERIRSRYIDYRALTTMHMDGLIVTGAVPVLPSLADEPYWPQFTELVEHARTHTLSTIWSCLAAHAAVLYLDNVQRHRLPRKLTGVFEIDDLATGYIRSGVGTRYFTPHSRYNEVREADLAKAGYRIVSGSAEVGVDIFEKDTPSRFVFVQGHPEYSRDTLMREYRRDIGQYLAGECDELPELPRGYFAQSTSDRLEQFASEGSRDRRIALMTEFPDATYELVEQRDWSSHATGLINSWIARMVGEKIKRAQATQAA